MGMLDRVVANFSDVRAFGPSFLLRHLGRVRRGKMVCVSIRGFGKVHVRAGNSDVAAIRQIFGQREYDMSWPGALGQRIRSRYNEIVASGAAPIIVDAGANIGAASLWFAKEYPGARIVAVEPDPANAAVLRRNLENKPNHVVVEAAIGSERGYVTLSEEPFGWAVQTARAHSGLPVVTMDDAFAAAGGGVPFIAKIDIEGFESDLFASNLDWIDRCYMIVLEPHDWLMPGKHLSRTFQQALAQHPFELFVRGENIAYVRV
ncbi:MAG TPA: FkbM family methyltransferase [Novosphingobium sp.]